MAKIADPALELYPSDPLAAALVDGLLTQDDDMRAGFYCMNYPARFGFETALGVANEDASQPAQESSERTAMVRTALLDRILPRHLGARPLSIQGCSHRLRTAECCGDPCRTFRAAAVEVANRLAGRHCAAHHRGHL